MARISVVYYVLMISLLPSVVSAGDFDRINVHFYDEDRRTIHHSGPISESSLSDTDCFPYGCGGIEGPLRNSNPDARKSENLTACIYGRDGILLYEREGKICSYRYIDSNTRRVERRR